MTALSLKRIGTIKNFEWAAHIIVWCLFIGEKWLNHYPQADNFLLFGFYDTIFLLITFILPIYLNAFILIPAFLKRKQWLSYLILLICMIIFVSVGRGLWTVFYFEWMNVDYSFWNELLKWTFRDYVSLDKFIFSRTSLILGSSFAYRLVKDWIDHERIQSTLQSEKITMELAFLKAQIDPHFLFNTLNNLYALSLEEKAQRTSNAITKMGAMMRYNLHEAQSEKISLSKELDYLEQYIELQKLRVVAGSHVAIQTTIEYDAITDETIAPMILLPFIENAFKHGISTVDDTAIEVKLTLKEGILSLRIKNSIRDNMSDSGIGLKNVKNRLHLLYPRQHKLNIVNDNNLHIVDLELNLRK